MQTWNLTNCWNDIGSIVINQSEALLRLCNAQRYAFENSNDCKEYKFIKHIASVYSKHAIWNNLLQQSIQKTHVDIYCKFIRSKRDKSAHKYPDLSFRPSLYCGNDNSSAACQHMCA